MTNKTAKIINAVYACLTSLMILAVAALLIWSAWDIYDSGANRPYTQQSIGAHFAAIAPAVYACLIIIFGGILVHLFLPCDTDKLKGSISCKARHSIMMKKLYSKGCSESVHRKLGKALRVRQVLVLIGILLYIAGAVLSLMYVTDKSNFPVDDPNTEVLHGAIAICVCMAIPFVYSIVLTYLNSALLTNEIKLIKQELSASSQDSSPITKAPMGLLDTLTEKTSDHEAKLILAVRCIAIVGGITLTVLGIVNGGISDVLGKAIKICTECIGLG